MSERKTVKKLSCVWDFEKIERWLNEMAMQGWVLDGIDNCFGYRFLRCEPGEYTVRLDMHPYDQAYISFMEETGAECIGHNVTWIFFRKKAANGAFNLFSDIDSHIANLNRIGRFLAIIGGSSLCFGIGYSFLGSSLGWMNMLCATIAMYGLGRIHGKKESLQQARQLHE